MATVKIGKPEGCKLTISMTEDEALELHAILGRIGGSEIISGIYDAMRTNGFDSFDIMGQFDISANMYHHNDKGNLIFRGRKKN